MPRTKSSSLPRFRDLDFTKAKPKQAAEKVDLQKVWKNTNPKRQSVSEGLFWFPRVRVLMLR
jgi:hypothetical protein